MKKLVFSMMALLAGSAVGCGNSDNNQPPNMPTVGAQIDRMGRAGVNTALTDPFDTVNGMTVDQVKNAYNIDSNIAGWVNTWFPKIAINLGILDALDGSCGNQFLAGATAVAGRYDGLSKALADDQIYVKTSSTTCTTYLGVEADATMKIPNSDCGGRTPLYNTIDITYALLAEGTLVSTKVQNGVASDADGQASVSNFPFLVDPL